MSTSYHELLDAIRLAQQIFGASPIICLGIIAIVPVAFAFVRKRLFNDDEEFEMLWFLSFVVVLPVTLFFIFFPLVMFSGKTVEDAIANYTSENEIMTVSELELSHYASGDRIIAFKLSSDEHPSDPYLIVEENETGKYPKQGDKIKATYDYIDNPIDEDGHIRIAVTDWRYADGRALNE